MKIALLLKPKKQKEVTKNANQAVVFNVEGNKVVGVENETLETKDVNYLSFWALTRRVKEIYTPEIDEEAKKLFKKLGISIKNYDELEDNRLFNTFIL